MEIQNEPLHTEAADLTLPAATLIICSRNRPQLLTETVASVLEGTEVPAELVIVDQSDQENYTLAELQSRREGEIRYIWVHTVGVGRARNTGITEAKYNILAITDDDVKVTPA
jgi:glycosyltransferase involved in cell wall biosynthesis